jgi:hypothetical protein
MMSTVFINATDPRYPRELARDARDPTGNDQADIENLARAYSRKGKLIRVHAVGQDVRPWRKQRGIDIIYEAFDGEPTADFRPTQVAS